MLAALVDRSAALITAVDHLVFLLGALYQMAALASSHAHHPQNHSAARCFPAHLHNLSCLARYHILSHLRRLDPACASRAFKHTVLDS